jgi:transposase
MSDVCKRSEEARMTLHKNARTCPASRRLLAVRVLERGWSLRAAAEAAGISEPAARKWLRRFREEGEQGLQDRSSAPRRVPNKTSGERVEAIVALRELRFTAAEIAETLGMAHSTVSAVLKREGKGRLPRIIEEPENRYERAAPGELIHIDVKKLGRIGAKGAGHRVTGDRTRRSRGAGWEFVHVCVDDATRLAYVEVLDDERALTCVGFLRRAVAHFASYGIRVRRLMTDNGNPYRSRPHALACRALGLKHLRTEPYRPRTNGKAERFIRTLLDGWAYRNSYRQAPNAPPRCPPSWTSTTAAARTARSATNHRSPGSPS